MNNKKKLYVGVSETLNALGNDYDRLHRAILFFLNVADTSIELSDKVYTKPAPSVDGWFNYGLNFNVEVVSLIENSWEKIISLQGDTPMIPLTTRDTILLGLLDYMGGWTAGG
jgi:hypothetical protein